MFTCVSAQIAWALNKGIKSELKQYWDVELGVTYIPWSKIREVQLEELKEGGILDVETLAPGNKKKNIKKLPNFYLCVMLLDISVLVNGF